MVADEVPAHPSATAGVDLGKRLLDYYDEFMAKEPRFLHNKFRGRLSEQACEDVAQEAFLKVATKAAAGDLGPDVKIGAYLRTTSWHLAIDTLRAREQTIGAEREAVPSQPGEDCDPLEELVRPAIAAMPRSQRRTVVQLQSQGLDDAQISAELGIARDRIHRDRSAAVSELRSQLGRHIRDEYRKKTRRAKKDR
ncbi:RNA polymerase sigma factor [Streptomyces sp. NPDC127063]|uniref:RNA polymerase sigma factor n=1 Tax=Streptomyces sp. NPDC127063 TaxID=3347123 RepID=UPI003663EE07